METFDLVRHASTPDGVASESDSSESIWTAILVLASALLIASISFNIFVLKQNRILSFQRSQLNDQYSTMQQTENIVKAMVQDVATFSVQHPDVRPILQKYGVTINFVAPQPPPVPPPAPH